ncbi:Meiosis-specific with OB domain-containing protein [Lachnellula suecica]|uniref:Meiosis-specific with OB domain-containing protein n=1 Tax=Lachnellula suecica TaxID=602035 RepID=A0A8T9CDU6_9HELO|nr:Meiosis-specific with OB domain-containing protein [Lachnellula suecica]
MQPGYPSIQSFYKREIAVEHEAAPEELPRRGDGFTEEELADAKDPLNRVWNPDREYEDSTIDQLVPGPRSVTFEGRIVNFTTVHGKSQNQPKASGWHYMLVKDDTGAISIKLYFAHKPYPLKLGYLVSVWTAFISDKTKDAGTIAGVNVFANLFPGRVTSDHIMLHTTGGTNGICHTPLGYCKGQPLSGLMNLDSYVGGGHDGVNGAKILVCVKSIGARKKITKKKGGECDLAEVLLFDHTGEVRMAVWDDMIESAKEWQPGQTILLISNPGFRVEYSGKGSIGMVRQTMIDIEPDFPDADWLRKHAASLTKKEGLCLEFPEDVWDVEAAEYGAYRPLYTLAELDTWVRSDGQQTFTGFLSLTIMEMSLVSYHRRNMLMCAECCGVPIFSNTLTVSCRNCSKSLTLQINPKILGTLLDETGAVAPGKLLWSERAWEALFGRSIKEVCVMSAEEVRLFEQRVIFMRMHLCFGWEERVGRLAVLGVFT